MISNKEMSAMIPFAQTKSPSKAIGKNPADIGVDAKKRLPIRGNKNQLPPKVK